MKAFVACIALALACVNAEAPGGYNYNRPSGGGSSFSGGFSGGVSGGGGGYRAVPSGIQTSEGQNVDQQLLEQVRQILLKEESQSSSGSGFGGGGSGGGYPAAAPSSSYGAPSSSYGAPSSSYGAPSYSSRVVGIDLEGVRQAIQVAQFEQQSSGSSGGYPSGPSSSYGAPARAPSGSYGAPF